MAGLTKVAIQEPMKDLAQRLQDAPNPKVKERLQILALLNKGMILSNFERDFKPYRH